MNPVMVQSRWNRKSLRWMALAAFLLLLLAPAAHSAEPNSGREPEVFQVGFTKASFRNVNQNDAAAAFRVFSDAIGRRFGNLIKSETRVFDDTPTFEAAIKGGSMKLMIMDAWQFLSMDIHQLVKPVFVVSENGKVGRKYLILTRRGSGLQTLADLRGKSIVQVEAASGHVGKHWLNTLLLANGFGSQETFFNGVEVVGKPSAAVLPVFFGKKPACFVDEPSFETMRELNPQVGRDLQVVAVSERFADIILCLSNSGWAAEKSKADTMTALSELHLEPAGQQILILFKIDKLVPFEEQQLDTVKKLRATYNQLQKRASP
jgi:phosphonate transport system substrate-binding protein